MPHPDILQIAAALCAIGGFVFIILDGKYGGIRNPVVSVAMGLYAYVPALLYFQLDRMEVVTNFIPYAILGAVWVLISGISFQKALLGR